MEVILTTAFIKYIFKKELFATIYSFEKVCKFRSDAALHRCSCVNKYGL